MVAWKVQAIMKKEVRELSFFFPSRFLIKNPLWELECVIKLEYCLLRKQLLFIVHVTGDYCGETTESLIGDFQYPLHRHGLSKN